MPPPGESFIADIVVEPDVVAAEIVPPVEAQDGPIALPVDDEEWDAEELPDSSRDGAWLPAGITVLVLVSLLVCAGLVLIASRQ